MAKKIKDITGIRFGKLKVIRKETITNYNTGRYTNEWVCKCDCGNTTVIKTTWQLTSGNTSSCGCEESRLKKTHGKSKSKTKEYRTWLSMKSRCDNPKTKRYHRYGGRGIKYCDDWKDFTNFFRDMGMVPLGKTLGRIDNDGNYCKENCRWESYSEQNRNTSRSRRLTLNGRTMNSVEWAKEMGIASNALSFRLSKFSVKDALTLRKNYYYYRGKK